MKKIFGLLLCLLLLLACATALADVDIDETHFPDGNFRNFLLNNTTYTTDGSRKYYTDAQIEDITDLMCSNKGISSLSGIENFVKLQSLMCDTNQLTSLDVSALTSLTSLAADGNELSTLDVSKNTALSWLSLSGNNLSSIDVSKNTKLKSLSLITNPLKKVDISGCPKLCNLVKTTERKKNAYYTFDLWRNDDNDYLDVNTDVTVVAGDFTSYPLDLKTLEFVEKERVNYKPIIKESRPELTVDTWLQEMAFEDEEYFKELDPDGPVITVEQDDGNPKIETWIDEKKVLRLKTFLTSPVKIKLKLTAVWAGQTATTNVYVDFFNCDMPKTIGFNDEYTISIGDKVKLVTNYDDGKWPYRKWVGLYYESVSEEGIVRVWADEYPDKTGACSYFEGLKAGTVVIRFNANQDGLNWAKDVTVTVIDPNAPTEMTEQKLNLKIKDLKLTASGTKAIKVTWTKLSKKDQKKVGKFVIEISTDKKFKKDVITKTVSAKKNSVTIKKLKPGKKYYVRIRAIKEEGNIRYVTKWFKKNIALKK